MKIFALVTFIFMQQVLAYETLERTNRDVSNGTLPFSYMCNEERLQNIEEKLKLLVDNDDNLRLKLDTMNSIINNQLAELKSMSATRTTAPTQTEMKKSNCTYSDDPLIDVCGNYNVDEKIYVKLATKSKSRFPNSCTEAFQQSEQRSGIQMIYLPEFSLEPFYVYCLADPEKPEAPWTIIQRRKDGYIDFYRKWAEYQKGFGSLEGEFFIGLDRLHALTHSKLHELWIQLEDFTNATGSANYSSFAIGDSSEAYALKILGSFKGDVGDSLSDLAGQKFTTQDVDNDLNLNGNCAVDCLGAWWYNHCCHSNLNGLYLVNKYSLEGITWYNWREEYKSLKYVQMAIRPVN